MGGLDLVKRLYSLDTLDTRFTSSSRAPLGTELSETHARIDPVQPTLSGASGSANNGRRGRGQLERPVEVSPPRWRTPEFYFYYVMFVSIVPLMFKAVYDVSKGS